MDIEEYREFVRPIRREVWGWRLLYALMLFVFYGVFKA